LQSTADYPLNLTWSGFTVTPLTITGAGSVEAHPKLSHMNTPPVVATVRASNGQSSYTAKFTVQPSAISFGLPVAHDLTVVVPFGGQSIFR